MKPSFLMNTPHQAHNDTQRDHFDLRTLSNPRMIPADSPYVQRHLERAIRAATITAADRVLDVGCGLGKFTLPLVDRGIDVTGLDLSHDLIRALGELKGERELELHQGDILEPSEDLRESFDVVTGFFVLHHLPDLVAAFRGLHTFLRPGGRVVFVEPNAYSPLFPVQITLTRGMSWRSDWGVFRMRRRKLCRALGAAGFKSIEHEFSGLFPPALVNRGAGPLEDRLDGWPLPGPISSFQVLSASI